MKSNQPYEKQWWMLYFNVQINETTQARFKRNRFTRVLYIFRFNAPTGNRWNEPGYGYGMWVRL